MQPGTHLALVHFQHVQHQVLQCTAYKQGTRRRSANINEKKVLGKNIPIYGNAHSRVCLYISPNNSQRKCKAAYPTFQMQVDCVQNSTNCMCLQPLCLCHQHCTLDEMSLPFPAHWPTAPLVTTWYQHHCFLTATHTVPIAVH